MNMHVTPSPTLEGTLAALHRYYLTPREEEAIGEVLACPIGGATGQGAYSSRDDEGHLLVTFTVARVLTGRLDGEDTKFLTGNTCDLAPGNLVEGRTNPRIERGPIDAYKDFIIPTAPDGCASPFGGSPEEQFEERKKLLHAALDALHSANPYI